MGYISLLFPRLRCSNSIKKDVIFEIQIIYGISIQLEYKKTILIKSTIIYFTFYLIVYILYIKNRQTYFWVLKTHWNLKFE